MLRPHPETTLLRKDVSDDFEKLRAGNGLTDDWKDYMTDLGNQVTLGSAPGGTQDVTALAGIKLNFGTQDVLIRVQSATAGNVDITADPQINIGFDGQRINVEGNDAVKTVKLDDGDGLQLTGGASFTLAVGDTISFHYNLTKNLWIENTRSKK